jgi:hypothetical protein
VLLGVGLIAATALIASLDPGADRPGTAAIEPAGSLRLLAAATVVVAGRPDLRALLAYPASASIIEGAVDLLCVSLAATVLGLGEGGAGYLNATVGAGVLLGGLLATALVGRQLGAPLIAASLVSAAALATLATAGSTPVVVPLLVLAGAVRAIQLITSQTLVQRTAPPEVLVHVLALQEGLRVGGIAVGALLAPALLGLGGAGVAFAGLAAAMALVVVLTARRVRAIEGEPEPATAVALGDGVAV